MHNSEPSERPTSNSTGLYPFQGLRNIKPFHHRVQIGWFWLVITLTLDRRGSFAFVSLSNKLHGRTEELLSPRLSLVDVNSSLPIVVCPLAICVLLCSLNQHLETLGSQFGSFYFGIVQQIGR